MTQEIHGYQWREGKCRTICGIEDQVHFSDDPSAEGEHNVTAKIALIDCPGCKEIMDCDLCDKGCRTCRPWQYTPQGHPFQTPRARARFDSMMRELEPPTSEVERKIAISYVVEGYRQMSRKYRRIARNLAEDPVSLDRRMFRAFREVAEVKRRVGEDWMGAISGDK